MAYFLPIVPGIVEPLTISKDRSKVQPIHVLRIVRNHTRTSPKTLLEALHQSSGDKQKLIYAKLSIYFIRQYTTTGPELIAELFGISMGELQSILSKSPLCLISDVKLVSDIDNSLRKSLILTIAYNPQKKAELTWQEKDEILKKYRDNNGKKHEIFFPYNGNGQPW